MIVGATSALAVHTSLFLSHRSRIIKRLYIDAQRKASVVMAPLQLCYTARVMVCPGLPALSPPLLLVLVGLVSGLMCTQYSLPLSPTHSTNAKANDRFMAPYETGAEYMWGEVSWWCAAAAGTVQAPDTTDTGKET